MIMQHAEAMSQKTIEGQSYNEPNTYSMSDQDYSWHKPWTSTPVPAATIREIPDRPENQDELSDVFAGMQMRPTPTVVGVPMEMRSTQADGECFQAPKTERMSRRQSNLSTVFGEDVESRMTAEDQRRIEEVTMVSSEYGDIHEMDGMVLTVASEASESDDSDIDMV